VRPRRASRDGFTLIELIAVTAIIGIAIGLAATRLDFMVPKYRLRGAAREVAGALKLAKARAVATGKDVYVEFDLPRGRYWLLVAFPKDPPDGDRVEETTPEAIAEAERRRGFEYQPVFERALPEGVIFVDVIFSDKERTSEGRARLRVSPFGTSAHTIVNLRNPEDRELAVKFNGFTGALSFYDTRKEPDELLEDAGP
jgi:prepilin-type N-terminal cleavage/methylation domain-containing protein